MYAGLIVLALFTLAGCGKTVGQITKIAHDVIDIGSVIYTDLKEDAVAVKEAVSPTRPEVPENHNK